MTLIFVLSLTVMVMFFNDDLFLSFDHCEDIDEVFEKNFYLFQNVIYKCIVANNKFYCIISVSNWCFTI